MQYNTNCLCSYSIVYIDTSYINMNCLCSYIDMNGLCSHWYVMSHINCIQDMSYVISIVYRVAKNDRLRYDTGHFPPIWPPAASSFGENDLYHNEPYDCSPPCITLTLWRWLLRTSVKRMFARWPVTGQNRIGNKLATSIGNMIKTNSSLTTLSFDRLEKVNSAYEAYENKMQRDMLAVER